MTDKIYRGYTREELDAQYTNLPVLPALVR